MESHARGVYLTENRSRMRTARVKQEEAYTRIIETKYMEDGNVGTREKSSQT